MQTVTDSPAHSARKTSKAIQGDTVIESTTAKKIGRPQLYSKELADEICEFVANGGFVSQLQSIGLPSHTTISRWINENEEFSALFARAREIRAETFADQIVEIADSEEDPQKARNRIDARKFVAMKLLPRVYGDKHNVEINQTIRLADEHAAALIELSKRKREAESKLIDVTPDPSPVKGSAHVIDQQVTKLLPRIDEDQG